MIVLQEIIRLYASVTKNNFSLFRDIGRGKEQTKFEQLYRGVESGKIFDDETACAILYKGRARIPISTYNSLKMRFFRRIVDSMYFIDSKKSFVSRFNRMQYETFKNTTLVRILMLYGAVRSAEYMADRTLRTARKYHMSAEAVICAETLAYCAAYAGRQREFEKYAAQASEWIAIRSADERADLFYHRVSSWYAANWSLQQDNLIEISNYIHTIDADRKLYNTNTLNQAYFHLQRIHAEVEQDYERIIAIDKEVVQFYKANAQFTSRQTLGLSAISAMSAHIWCGNYTEAYAMAKRCEQLIAKGRVNWFHFQEPYLILALRSGNYELAKSIFREVITNNRFNRRDPVTLEKWRLLEFYVRFITGADMKETLLPKESLKGRSKYKHYRAFSGTLSVLNKDLTGYNVVGVFAQIMYLLHIGDYDSLLSRDESLQTFRRKRLNKLNYRLSIFARLVNVIVRSGFDPEKAQKRAQPWLTKLRNVPPKFKGGTAETLEIIPLEELWGMMMRELRGGAFLEVAKR